MRYLREKNRIVYKYQISLVRSLRGQHVLLEEELVEELRLAKELQASVEPLCDHADCGRDYYRILLFVFLSPNMGIFLRIYTAKCAFLSRNSPLILAFRKDKRSAPSFCANGHPLSRHTDRITGYNPEGRSFAVKRTTILCNTVPLRVRR